ncbi:MAG TPA: RHS repeat-associated core domain-containing protein [Vicinamibacterales bacterium]|nr:RHS repeat-associated core domain-containing protein [Vicinamibacterales bacterium]
MNVARRLILLFLLSLAGIALAFDASAQHPILDATGIQPNRGSFSTMPFEHIDLATGSLVLTFTDLVLPGNAGRDLRFQRSYNSKVFAGWTFGIAGVPLRVKDTWPDTQGIHPRIVTVDSEIDVPTALLGCCPEIRVTDRFWMYRRDYRSLHLPDGSVGHYDSQGRLTTMFDTHGTFLTVSWNDPSVTITQHLGSQTREVELELPLGCYGSQWSLGCMPTSMTFQGRSWTYTDTEFTSPEGTKWRWEGATLTTPHGGRIKYTFGQVEFEEEGTTALRFREVIDVAARGGEANGTWEYRYSAPDFGLYSNTTVLAPDGTVTTYRHEHGPSTSNDYPGRGWVLKSRTVEKGGEELESEVREYVAIRIASANSNDALPELKTRTITRAGRQYRTEFSYSPEHYGDFHNPNKIEETGELERTTEREFTHTPGAPQFGPYILGLLSRERVTVDQKTFERSWDYRDDGFLNAASTYGITTTFSPDSNGNVASLTTATGKTTTFAYTWGQVRRITTPRYSITRTINPDGTVDSETQGGRTVGYQYDALSRLTRVVLADANDQVITYDNSAGATVRTRRTPSDVTTTLDGFGRPIATVDAVGVKTKTKYYADGRVKYAGLPFTGGADRGTTITYDGLGRVTRETHSGGAFREYDYSGGSVTIRDELGRPTVQTIEAFGNPDDGRPRTIRDAAQTTWTYEYTALGSVRSLSGGGRSRTWDYDDDRHLLEREEHPESGAVTYAYDAAGLLIRQTNAAGVVTEYGYDDNGRPTSINAGGRLTTITYESGSDNRASMTVDGVTTQFQYDSVGRLSSRTDTVDGQSFAVGYAYDGADRLTRIWYPSGRGVGYTYDAEGRTTRVFLQSTGANYATGFTYHATGSVEGFTAGNNTTTFLHYDDSRYWLEGVASGPLQLTDIGHDPVGNIVSITDARPTHSQSLTYDLLDRFTSASAGFGTPVSYDAHGNLQSSAFTYTGNPFRLAAVNGQPVSYDAVGRMTTGPGATYSYTQDHRLASATVGGTTTSFKYDADGWRVRKTAGGNNSYFVRGPGGELLAERLVLQGVARWRDYIYVGNQLIAVEVPVAGTPVTPCAGFTDSTLQPGVTPVRAVHVTELRTCVNALRTQRGLSAATWTDPTLVAGDTAKAAHILELRNALEAAYPVGTAPTYQDPQLNPGSTVIKEIHITQLREATAALPAPPSGDSTRPYYYHRDHIGSTRAITDDAGATVARYDYDAFGIELPPTASFRDPRLFTGAERDTTNLDYLGARYYSSALRRFIRPDDPGYGDPFDPQSMNLYAYALNNPLRYVDPTGHCSAADQELGYCEPPDDSWLREFLNKGQRLFFDSWIVGKGVFSDALDLVSGAEALTDAGLDGRDWTKQPTINPWVLSGAALYTGKLRLGPVKKFAAGKLETHFAKHAAEWGAGNITKAAYLKHAQRLLNSAPGGEILGSVRANGDILRYNVRTNEFVVGTAQGEIRTLFRPTDGLQYWLRQVR